MMGPSASDILRHHMESVYAQWLATMSGGFAATRAGLYTNMPMLFGFVPKFVIWWSVDAGIELRPGAVGVVGAGPAGDVGAGAEVGAGAAAPGWHCE